MTIDSFKSLYIVYVELNIEQIYTFLKEDSLTSSFEIELFNNSIEDVYMKKLYGQSPAEFLGAVFFKPKQLKKGVVVLGNSGGWATLCNYICKGLNSINIQFDINSLESEIHRNSLVMSDSGKIVRSVQSIVDDKGIWQFNENGEALWFENIEYYKVQEKAKRIDQEILVQYCEKLSLNVKDPSFFESNDESIFVKRQIRKTVV